MDEVAILARGDWPAEAISVRWAPSTFAPPPEVEQLIASTWEAEAAKPGMHLFDGPLCRMEAFTATPSALELTLSRTSYRPFLGTNGRHAGRLRGLGATASANALGSSAVILTCDGRLVFGERGPHLALYPNRAHPFGGCLEPATDLDVTRDTMRELREELGLVDADVRDLRLLALGSDLALGQPELTYVCRVALTQADLARRLDGQEHRGLWSVADTASAVAEALTSGRPMTPLTRLGLLVIGGWRYGDAWFERHAPG